MAGISDKALKSQYAENKLRYNGGNELQSKEFSDGSGLEAYDAENRMYDPQLGRFWQIDPLGDINESYSPYSFANNNPILLNDPIGLLSDSTHPQVLPAVTVTHAFNLLPDKKTPVTTGLADTKGGSMEVGEVAGFAPSTSTVSAKGASNSSGNGMAMVLTVGALSSEGAGASSGITIVGGGSLQAVPPLLILGATVYLSMGFHPTGIPSNIPVPHGEISISKPYIPEGLIRRLSEGAKPNAPSYPGADPTVPPGEGWVWRGPPGSVPGAGQGAWYNPGTKETLHPDLDHPAPIGPHWDWRAPDGTFHRLYPDGRVEPSR
jgi:RHS repeat-associated protein